jgi:hypothetical protein
MKAYELKRFSVFAYSAIMVAASGCSAPSLEGSTPLAVGTSACRNYLSNPDSPEMVDDSLQQTGWTKKSSDVPEDIGLGRRYQKENVTVSFVSRKVDAFRKPLADEQISCMATLYVSAEDLARSAAASANEVLKLRELSPGRYATEGDNPNRAVIGYGPPASSGKILVLVEMYNGAP